jgi:hypothetical protein
LFLNDSLDGRVHDLLLSSTSSPTVLTFDQMTPAESSRILINVGHHEDAGAAAVRAVTDGQGNYIDPWEPKS